MKQSLISNYLNQSESRTQFHGKQQIKINKQDKHKIKVAPSQLRFLERLQKLEINKCQLKYKHDINHDNGY